ncbi:MAG: cadmium-translocating P-type ATPase [Lachnospiraceae bacterium]|nr:cadmium-translocating P-type ATPase [Lachnospiraceae bacterium]
MLKRIILSLAIYVFIIIVSKVSGLSNVWIIGALSIIPYCIAGADVVNKAFRNIKRGKVFDENFLMTLATFGAFAIGEFNEAVAVMIFYQVGELFQSYAVNKSRKSISDLLDICPEVAAVERNGEIACVFPEEVNVGDIIVAKPGNRIAIDGVVISGNSSVDTSSLTGESIPKDVKPGDEVISGCINLTGLIRYEARKEYKDSTVSKIMELVENASANKAPVENFITKFAKVYTPIVVVLACLLAFVPPIFMGNISEWIFRACTFLVISCPCALVISVPLSFFGGIGAASSYGVLIKGSTYLESMSKLKTVVFDKTGTLTTGVFKVTKVVPNNEEYQQEEILKMAAMAESYSNHPIAKSIMDAYGKDVNMSADIQYEEITGQGVRLRVGEDIILVGNEMLMNENKMFVSRESVLGTTMFIAKNGKLAGTIIISDVVKPKATDTIKSLRKHGVKKCVMLTGDSESVGYAVAEAVGLDQVYAKLLPNEKVERVEELLKENSVDEKLAYVGDGINDAPVLTRADIGIAMGSLGSDAAIEAADVVIMDDDISKISGTIKISHKTMNIVKGNIVFALGIKFGVLVLGALGMANMWQAVFADVGVAVLAILNSMRMLSYKPDKNKTASAI